MSRLVAFGCSITYGQGLPDCLEVNKFGHIPSKFSWPTLTANKLSLDVVNHGMTGASNKRILLNVLNVDIKSDDIVVFLWSYTCRGLICPERNSFIDIFPTMDDNEIKHNFYSLHSDYDLAHQSILNIHHANMFLSIKNVRVYNFFFDKVLDDVTNKFGIDLIYIPMHSFRIDKGADKHPGIRSQEKLSQIIFKHMQV